MTTIKMASDLNTSSENAELPRPDATSTVTSEASSDGNSQQRPLPNITDSGRISFGAAMRLPVQK